MKLAKTIKFIQIKQENIMKKGIHLLDSWHSLTSCHFSRFHIHVVKGKYCDRSKELLSRLIVCPKKCFSELHSPMKTSNFGKVFEIT